MPKRISYLTLLALTLLLASCSAISPPVPTVVPTTITFAFPESDRAYYESLLPTFREQHPEIQVSLQAYRGDTADLATNQSDVLVAAWFTLEQPNITPERFLSLNELFLQDTDFNPDDYYPGAIETFTVQGRTWGLPYGLDLYVQFTNRELFAQADAPTPQTGWSWDEFLATADAVRDLGGDIYGYAPEFSYTDSIFFLFQGGGSFVDENLQPTLDSPENVAAMQWYSDLFHQYGVAPTEEQAGSAYGHTENPFSLGIVGGKIGMWPGMFSMRGGTQQGDVDWNFDWGMAQLPQDVAPFTAAFYEGYVINAQTDNPQESWEWLDFLSEQVNPRMIPARRSLAESREFEDAVGVEAAEVARASAEDMLVINAEIWQPINLVAAVFIEAVEKIVNEGADPQQALQQAQSAAESQP